MVFAPIAKENGRSKQSEIERLERIVQRRVNGGVRHLRVLVFPEGLLLQGNVATYHAKQLAQHAIMRATQLPNSRQRDRSRRLKPRQRTTRRE